MDATYKADLRELNDLNFQRFDAKVEQRWAQLDAKLEQRLAQLDIKLEQRVVALRAELAETKSSLLRWMFGFWIGTLAPLAGLIIYLTR